MKKRSIHGMRYHRAYNTWNHMMFRCYSKKDKRYPVYGGRGIKVTSKWHNFIGFWEDMKNGYKDNLTLDRINNNKNYCKSNCRWATWNQQARNRSDAFKILFKGKITPLKDVCEINNIPYIMAWLRINKYHWDIERAIFTPSRNHNGRTKL